MRTQHARGYSLVGLLVSLTITAILLGIGIPSMAGLIQNNRMTTQLNSFRTELNYARTEAIQHNLNVIICTSPDEQHCSADHDWHEGWIVFIDNDNDHRYTDADVLLRSHGPISSGIQINYYGSGFGHYVAFRGIGTTSTNGTFRFCDANNPASARALVINLAGRVRVGTRMPNGNMITCL